MLELDGFVPADTFIAVEEKYAIKLLTGELDSLNNVGDLVRMALGRTRG